MSLPLAQELHEARDRILKLKQQLEDAREREIDAYIPFLDEQISSLSDVLQRTEIPERYRVAVVGRFKVGKSSFINKLIDERLAGVHTNPETAAISVLRYDTHTRAEIELISQEEWDELASHHAEDPKNPDVKRYDRFFSFGERSPKKAKAGDGAKSDLTELAKEWVAPGGQTHLILPAQDWSNNAGKKAFLEQIKRFTSSKEPLHYLVNKVIIYAPIPILKDQIELIDTPGLDDPEQYRVRLTEEVVKDVDAILFLTISGASYGQSDKEFIIRQLRHRQIKHLQLIVTKCDETFRNAVSDASGNEDTPPTYQEFCQREEKRVREETAATLDELLKSNQLSDDEGYYFMEQLDNVPVRLISASYHDEGDAEKGGIAGIREGLYQVLSTSRRFEQSRNTLRNRLESVLENLRRSCSQRLNTLETEFDPAKVREEIESIQISLSKEIDIFAGQTEKALGLLAKDQEANLTHLPAYIGRAVSCASVVLDEVKDGDLIKHWKTRRNHNWGHFHSIETKVADKVFPQAEVFLKRLLQDLNAFMDKTKEHLKHLQDSMGTIESEHHLAGLEPLDIAASQAPIFDDLQNQIQETLEIHRYWIIFNLENFVTKQVEDQLTAARRSVADIVGKGTTFRQGHEVSKFHATVRSLLDKALSEHLDLSIRDFASGIRKSAESVVPRIRDASEGELRQRLKAIESSLQVAKEGQKEQTELYLNEMLTMVGDFAAVPPAIAHKVESLDTLKGEGQ